MTDRPVTESINEPGDALLDSLAARLTPVKPLRPQPLWLGAAVAVVLAAIYIFFYYSPRPEISGLINGYGLHKVMVCFKPLLFLATGAGALWAVTDLARPEGRLRMRTLVPLIAVMGIVLGMLASEFASKGTQHVVKHLHDPAILCFMTIFCGGMAGLVAMWRLWLRRVAPSNPTLLGTMAGLAASSLMAAAYTVHCDRDAPIYIVVIYFGSVAITTGVAALLGRKILRW